MSEKLLTGAKESKHTSSTTTKCTFLIPTEGSDLFTNLDLWVLGLAVSHMNES